MHPITAASFVDELEKIAKKIKSNDPMPPRTKANVNAMMESLRTWDSPHKEQALQFAEKVTPVGLFELLHGMRRWYSGQTMTRVLHEKRDALSSVMQLKPTAAKGAYRGFKVPKDNPLAKVQVGQTIKLDVTRNRNISSWSLTEAPTNKFSGGGKGKVGLIVKLVDTKGATPLLAPPEKTAPWFNEMYSHLIGTSFRPKEQEYLISGPSLKVEVVRVKR